MFADLGVMCSYREHIRLGLVRTYREHVCVYIGYLSSFFYPEFDQVGFLVIHFLIYITDSLQKQLPKAH